MSIDIEKAVTKLNIAAMELKEFVDEAFVSDTALPKLRRVHSHIRESVELLESPKVNDKGDFSLIESILDRWDAEGVPVRK